MNYQLTLAHPPGDAAGDRPETIFAASTVSWDGVAGLDEAKAEARAEVVEFLREPERFGRLGARIPKGILLYGPPGTKRSNSLRRRSPARRARNSTRRAPRPSSRCSPELGAARIRKLFSRTRPRSSKYDELDAVDAQRTGHGFQPRAGLVDAEPAARRAGRIRGRVSQVIVMVPSEPAPEDLDVPAAAPGPLRSAGARLGARPRRPRGSPARPHEKRQAACGRRRPEVGPMADGRPHRRRAFENIANEAAIFAGRSSQKAIRQSGFEDAMERVVNRPQQRKGRDREGAADLAYTRPGTRSCRTSSATCCRCTR